MDDSGIAIIGMAGRFPRARNLDEFWKNLRDGVESISRFTDKQLLESGVRADEFSHPNYVRAAAVLEDVELFDAEFFGFSPREAEVIDPQHRVFLECAWAALEDAGYDPDQYDGLIGVYAGSGMSTYILNLAFSPQHIEAVGDFQANISSGGDFLPTRVSYKLNLKGPSINIQTACSTSLVAVHLACQSLLNGESDIMLAGGVTINLPQKAGYIYREGGINSPDGHCRAFDIAAQGTVGGSGVGVVVLKRCADAIRDGDTIHAVILGSAVNNDGMAKAGYTAPGLDGQAEVITEAQAIAGIDPETISYVEAHGTGTALGDPIEVAALTQAFRAKTDKQGFCALGSVKTNLGHLDTAAGVAGLIKTVLSLKNGFLPPSLHFKKPNPKIEFDNSPFYVNSSLREWKANGSPRRAGVSSFGIGGTNAHVILEEAPRSEEAEEGRQHHLLVLSAKTSQALDKSTDNLVQHLKDNPGQNLADVAYTLQVGRKPFNFRRALVCTDGEDAIDVLGSLDRSRVSTSTAGPKERPVMFMFPGQGAQYPNMGRELYEAESAFREQIDFCCEMLMAHFNYDLRDVLYPETGRVEEAGHRLRQTGATQPALFVTELALARLWLSWGVQPAAMIGHSIGEYAAACLAEVFSVEDGLALVSARGRLMEQLPEGRMLAVPLCHSELEAQLGKHVSIAAINGPSLCVASGPNAAIDELQRRLYRQGVNSRVLHTSHAFHSDMTDPAVGPFTEIAAKMKLNPPKVPFLSNVTGTWITPEQATDPRYWGTHMRLPVRFADGLSELLRPSEAIALEVGPGQTLGTLARQQLKNGSARPVLSSLPPAGGKASAGQVILTALGQLWLSGVRPDWVGFNGDYSRRRVQLPTYPFEGRRYWVDRKPAKRSGGRRGSLYKKGNLDWFYILGWKQAAPLTLGPDQGASATKQYLILSDPQGLGANLADRLREQGHRVTTVRAGSFFEMGSVDAYSMNPAEPSQYSELIRALEATGDFPNAIVNLWGLWEDSQLWGGTFSMLHLAQALGSNVITDPVNLVVVTNGAHGVTGDEPVISPAQAALLGPCKVIPQEYPNIKCRCIDVMLGGADAVSERTLQDLMTELNSDSPDRVVAFRGRRRWIQTFEPVILNGKESLLKDGGVYLITGGLGRAGRLLAGHLAGTRRARLVLIGRTALPDEAGWDQWLAAKADDEASKRIEAIRSLRASGAEAVYFSADVADEDSMREIVNRVRGRFGRIDGVIHAAAAEEMAPISETTESDCRSHFRAKANGLVALERVLEGEHPDFVLLLSSLSSVLGGLGHFAYSAANLFMDAFAQERSRRDESAWRSVNLDGWTLDEEQAGSSDMTMSPAEGIEVIERVLSTNAPTQVIVSTNDLETRIAKWVKLGGLEETAGSEGPATTLHQRPESADPYVAPRDEREEAVAKVWQELLGIERVGIHDNFFDLGGHSLVATQIVARLRKIFQGDIPLRSIMESPTVAGLSEAIGKPYEIEADFGAQTICRAERDRELPLSFSQQRLWFLEQFEPDNPIYNLASLVRLNGPVNLEAIEQSLNEIVRRHEVLRTRFTEVDGRPAQIIIPALRIDLSTIDLGAMLDGEREEAVRRIAAAESQRPFNLSAGSLLRASILRLAALDHVVLFAMHHIISDGWSMGVLIREVSSLYASFSKGRAVRLSDLPIQYADYAVWQREWLSGEVLESQLGYWKQQLGGELPVLELPTDKPRPPVQTYRGGMVSFEIARSLTTRLRTLSQSQGATLFMVLMAAFKALLSRYTGQQDIIVGTPIANRGRVEIEGLIGFFINTLALRTDLSGNPTFLELLDREAEVALGAFAHQDLPFEMLVETLQSRRNLSHAPIFQVMLILQNAPTPALELSGLTISPFAIESNVALFDLLLSIQETGGGLSCSMSFNADLFQSATIVRLLDHFENLLSSAVEDPSQRIAELALLTGAEREQLLSGWNDVGDQYAESRCIHELFERRAAISPDAEAVIYGDRYLTFSALNIQANRLAHYLQSLGVGPDEVVAICLDRSIEMVVALLAVVKAGGAYVPLDPAYPSERIAVMFEDSKAKVLLTHSNLLDSTPSFGGRTVCVDTDGSQIEKQSCENPVNGLSGDNLLYVLYTSGSTGRPKGVAMVQKALSNLLLWQLENSSLSTGTRTVQYTSLSFDVSFQEIFATWLSGAALVLVGDELRRDAARFLGFLADNEIGKLFLPFIALQQLAEAAGERGVEARTGLREVITAGEQLKVTPQIVSFFRRVGPCFLYNQYGPTETHVVTAYSLPDSPEEWEELPPIGQPVANTKAYLLDEWLQPVPVGVTGGLYIGGCAPARGYLRRPAETAERFVPDLFSRIPGMRLYRTGDLARRLPDGNIAFLGRYDNQVKIRGFRIELGEVESVLGQHPLVQEAVVVAQETAPGLKRLVAYVVANHQQGTSASELQRFLKEKLPAFMVPSIYVLLEALPLTPSGKVDRLSLPSPGHSDFAASDSYEPPRTPVEEVVAAIYCQVLGVEQAGASSNFFELGGHSLLATQLASRVQRAFDVAVPLRTVFEAPTVAELANRIEEALRGRGAPAPSIERKRGGVLPLSFAQRRLWFLHQLEPDSPAYNIFAAVRLTGSLCLSALEETFNEIIRRHESLRTTFVDGVDEPAQEIAKSLEFRLAVSDLTSIDTELRESAIKQLARDEARRPFRLDRLPLLRVSLLKLDQREHVALLNMHHIISDGWSMGVLIREVATLYEAISKSAPSPLEELSIQYGDFARWQREWMDGEVLEGHLSYWRKQLAGRPAAIDLPTDRPRPLAPTSLGGALTLRIGTRLTDELKALCRCEGATMFMALVAGLKSLLYRYSGAEDIVVGSAIANRNRPEIEGLIGFFVNTLVLRTDLSGQPSFRELLKRAREVALGAYAHQDLPFERLVEDLRPERSLGRTPLYQVLLLLQNTPNRTIEMPGLSITPIQTQAEAVDFDLVMNVEDTGQGLVVLLSYNRDLFEESTISRMLSHFRNLLESATANPDESIARAAMLDERELCQLLADSTGADSYTGDLVVHQMFENWAESSPGLIALSFQGKEVTYGSLNAASNRIAHGLMEAGVGSNQPVAMMLETGPLQIMTLLGILKAGAAFVCLDPNYPTPRLELILEEVQPRCIITESVGAERHQQLMSRLIGTADCEVILMDAQGSLAETVSARDGSRWLRECAAASPSFKPEAGNLAYLVYTSGSTGRPKGIMQSHRGLGQFVSWEIKQFSLGPRNRVAQWASITYDASYAEIFGALCSGATLCMAESMERSDPRAVVEWLGRESIGLLITIPSFCAQMLQFIRADCGASLPRFEYMLLAGEVLPADLARDWQNCQDGRVRLFNLYGPTESILATFHEIREVRPEQRSIPVGRPIDGRKVFILDRAGQVCPTGVKGEVYIRSSYLTDGYYKRPEETAKAYLRKLPIDDSREPVFRTGDLARRLRDGSVEFLGRIDNQVKIRGMRVELEDIETALLRHPAVIECAVAVRKFGSEDERLVAYAVTSGKTPVAELRSHMRESLPEHMSPREFVNLEALPRTPSGKVDRGALPEPPEQQGGTDSDYVPPRTLVETTIAEVWREFLRMDRISVYENFFELGGHSLLATQVVNKLRHVCSVDLPLRDFFEAPTIAALAERVEGSHQSEQADPDRIAALLEQVKNFSDEEVRAMLYERKVLAKLKEL